MSDDDELTMCYACGGLKDAVFALLCSRCQGGRICPSCDGQGDVQLRDEGDNKMYWQCPACQGKGVLAVKITQADMESRKRMARLQRMNHLALLRKLDAGPEAIEWYADREGEAAWRDCARGDWMLWIAARLKVDRRLLVEAACDCAELALVYIPAGEDRPRLALETARRWARGDATVTELRAAAQAAA